MVGDKNGTQVLISEFLLGPLSTFSRIRKEKARINQHPRITSYDQSRNRAQSHIRRDIMVRVELFREAQEAQNRLE